jgi:hypothetical protein
MGLRQWEPATTKLLNVTPDLLGMTNDGGTLIGMTLTQPNRRRIKSYASAGVKKFEPTRSSGLTPTETIELR